MKKLLIAIIVLLIVVMGGITYMYMDINNKLKETEQKTEKSEISVDKEKENNKTEDLSTEESIKGKSESIEKVEETTSETVSTDEITDNLKKPEKREEVKNCIMENTKGTSCIYNEYEPRILYEVYQELLASGELSESCQGGTTTLDRINFSIQQKINGNGICDGNYEPSPISCVTDNYDSGCIENLSNLQINQAIADALISGYYDASCSPVSLDELTDDLEADNKWLVDTLQAQKHGDEPCTGGVNE